MSELEFIRRKIGEVYVLMTRLKEFRSIEFYTALDDESLKLWIDLIKANKDWIDAYDERRQGAQEAEKEGRNTEEEGTA